MDTEKTPVIFKMVSSKPKYNGYPNDCIAFLPSIEAGWGNLMSYQHIGQHGEASLSFYYDCRSAYPSEYASLKAELESIGYNLDIRKRLTKSINHDRI